MLGAVVKLSWCLCSDDDTARVIKICSTQIWMRMWMGCDSRCCSKCSPPLLDCNPIFPVHYFHFLLFICFRPDSLASLSLSACSGFCNVNEWFRMCNLCTWKRASIHISHRSLSRAIHGFDRADETSIYFHASPSLWAHRNGGGMKIPFYIRKCLSSILFLLFAFPKSYFVLGGGRGGCDAAQRLIQKRPEHVIAWSLSMC